MRFNKAMLQDGAKRMNKWLKKGEGLPNWLRMTDMDNKKEQIVDFPTLHTVATSGSYNDLLDKPNIPSGVVVDLNLDGTSNNAVANSAVVGGLNDKIEASDISFGFDADTKEIYIEVK